MKIQVINKTSSRVPLQYLQNFLDLIVKELKRKTVEGFSGKSELTLVFLESPEARSLNMEFRGKDYPTDVLSFESVEEESLGELVFCYEVLALQAEDHKITLRDEMAYLMLHGILHLLGFEHEGGGLEAEKMYALQDEIFSKINEL